MNNFDFNTFSVNLQISSGIFLNIAIAVVIFMVYKIGKGRHKTHVKKD